MTRTPAHPFLLRSRLVLLALIVCSPFAISFGETPGAPSPEIESLTVHPSSISLDSSRDIERVVAVAAFSDGITRDVSAEAEFKFAAEGIATLTDDRRLRPAGDGETTLRVAYGGLTAEVSIKVANATRQPATSFMLDVEPILMRAGCNAGSCHGSAQGKNGFRLSLFGFDPKMDYEHLTRQRQARRLTTAEPPASLILQKATTGVAHEGGLRFDKESALYGTLLRWIDEGARFDADAAPLLTHVEILPDEMVLYGGAEKTPGQQHRLTVRAYYSDGTDRDVTDLALLSSTNETSAAISPHGEVTAHARGEASIIARYGTRAVAAQVIVLPPNEEFIWPNPAEHNYIDELIDRKLKRLRIAPSPISTDAVFVRRVYLDIIGIPPTREEVERFVGNTDAAKRANLVDDLLDRPEFPEVWAMKWAELLRIESASRRISKKAMYGYTTWLRDQIVRDVPMDQMARELLTSVGGNFANPASNFYLVESNPKLVAENVAQVFTGIRIQCAQCHNHPFERWTMDDYYGFAAFFAQIGRKGAEDPRETIVFNSGKGEVKHIQDGRVMKPKLLGEADPSNLEGRDRREVIADWLISPDNPWFSKSFANRIWSHFMGRGIVEPPDDLRVTNPPSNPALFRELGSKFAESGYDLRGLVRDICNSRTYQAATATNPTNEQDLTNFSHRIPKRFSAEQLLDSICHVTETPQKFRGLPLGASAIQVADGNTGNYFLKIFGRPDRTSACTCDRRDEPTLSQALHLINGSTVASRVRHNKGRLGRLMKEGQSNEEIVNDIYLAAFARPPTPEEKEVALTHINEANKPEEGLEDFFWAILNSKEFVFNH